MKDITIRRVEREDLDDCVTLEKICYQPIEQASRDFIEKRIEVYPDGFYVAEHNGRIIGMVNCGATHQDDITDEEFKKLIGHVRNGKNSVIFSLAVHPDYRGKGIAKTLLKQIINVSQDKEKNSVLLLCKDQLIEFYEHLGFAYNKTSNSDYGGYTWHEMSFPLSAHN